MNFTPNPIVYHHGVVVVDRVSNFGFLIVTVIAGNHEQNLADAIKITPNDYKNLDIAIKIVGA